MVSNQQIMTQQPLPESHLSLREFARFELTSWIGRTLYWRYPPEFPTRDRMLNLGAGEKLLDGFVNANFYSIRSMFRSRSNWMMDLRFPIHCKGEYWDGVFMEHTLEHLYPDHAQALLLEVFRILKPGAWVRIIVPDLQKYIQNYCGESVHPLFKRWVFPAEAIHSLTQKYFHCSVWDVALLSDGLQRAGFSKISESSFRKGSDTRLLQDSEDRQWESLYVEAQKPISELLAESAQVK